MLSYFGEKNLHQDLSKYFNLATLKVTFFKIVQFGHTENDIFQNSPKDAK